MCKFMEGVITTVCVGFVVKFAYDLGRCAEARKNAKAWNELKEFSEKAMADIEAFRQKAEENKETEVS